MRRHTEAPHCGNSGAAITILEMIGSKRETGNNSGIESQFDESLTRIGVTREIEPEIVNESDTFNQKPVASKVLDETFQKSREKLR
jgi:hypothetical protein